MNNWGGKDLYKENFPAYGSSDNLSSGLSRGELLAIIGGVTTVIGDSIALYGTIVAVMEARQADQQQQQQQQQMQNQLSQIQQQLQEQQQTQQEKNQEMQQQMDQFNKKVQQPDAGKLIQQLMPACNGTNNTQNGEHQLKQKVQQLEQQMNLTQKYQEKQLKVLQELLHEFKKDRT